MYVTFKTNISMNSCEGRRSIDVYILSVGKTSLVYVVMGPWYSQRLFFLNAIMALSQLRFCQGKSETL